MILAISLWWVILLCLKGLYYSYAWSHSSRERRTSFEQDYSLENWRYLLMFSTGFTWLSALLLFLYQSPSSFLCMVFYSISSNIDQFLLVNPSAHVFFFGDFNVHHKDWLSYSGGTDRLFPSQMTLLGWLTFLLGFLIAIRTVLLFGINLFPLMLVFVLQWYGFPFIGKFLSSGCLSFHWLSNKLKTGCPVSFAGS